MSTSGWIVCDARMTNYCVIYSIVIMNHDHCLKFLFFKIRRDANMKRSMLEKNHFGRCGGSHKSFESKNHQKLKWGRKWLATWLVKLRLHFKRFDGKVLWRTCPGVMPDLRTLIPCIRDMARSGLSALSVRIVLKAWMPPAPTSEAMKLMRDT